MHWKFFHVFPVVSTLNHPHGTIVEEGVMNQDEQIVKEQWVEWTVLTMLNKCRHHQNGCGNWSSVPHNVPLFQADALPEAYMRVEKNDKTVQDGI